MPNEVKKALSSLQAIQADLEKIGMIAKQLQNPNQLKQVVTDEQLYQAVYKLFEDGHHAQAITKACIFLDNLVKKISEISDTGDSLMRTALSPKKPVLQLNDLSNRSEEDEQRGHMELLAGVMAGIRNPRSHEHDWEDTELRAIQILSFINYLVERVKTAKKNSYPP